MILFSNAKKKNSNFWILVRGTSVDVVQFVDVKIGIWSSMVGKGRHPDMHLLCPNAMANLAESYSLSIVPSSLFA